MSLNVSFSSLSSRVAMIAQTAQAGQVCQLTWKEGNLLLSADCIRQKDAAEVRKFRCNNSSRNGCVHLSSIVPLQHQVIMTTSCKHGAALIEPTLLPERTVGSIPQSNSAFTTP
jgi:hypothetical protein